MADSPIKKKTEKETTSVQGLGSPDAVSIEDIKDLFQLMRDNEIAELKIEQHGAKVHIVSKGAQPPPQPAMVQMMPGVAPVPMMNMAPAPIPAPSPQVSAPANDSPGASGNAAGSPSETSALPSNAKTVASPMVGTFYRSSSPEAAPFVREGDIVNEDTVLCIIEAMKLMNEIKAETKGKILKVLLENGMPVEFNQPLFLIEP